MPINFILYILILFSIGNCPIENIVLAGSLVLDQ